MTTENTIEKIIIAVSSCLEHIKNYNLNKLAESRPEYKGLFDKPWIIILGHEHSGKESLLRAANLNFAHFIVDPHKTVTLCISENTVYLKLPKEVLTLDSQEIFWEKFYCCLDDILNKKNIDGVTITLNCFKVSNQPELLESQLESFSKTLLSLQQYNPKSFPVYVAINHFDLISGFNEYFSALSSEERKQAFGITLLQSSKNNKKILEDFHQRLDNLLHYLHQDLIRKLHHTRNIEQRNLVQDFPLQIESLRNILVSILNSLSLGSDRNFLVRGLFFVSNTHSGLPMDRIGKTIEKQYNIIKFNPQENYALNKSYFSHQLLNDTISNDPFLIKQIIDKNSWRAPLAWGAGIAVSITLLSLVGLYGYQFSKNLNAINNAQQSLSQYHLITQLGQQQSINPNQLLQALDALENAENALTEQRTWVTTLLHPNNHFSKISGELDLAYHQAINKFFMPLVIEDLETTLHDPDAQNPAILFGSLKAYLMLAQPNHLNQNYLKQKLKSIWLANKNTNKANLEKRLYHLQQALKNPNFLISVNYQLIKNARLALNNLPPDFLGFVLLKDKNMAALDGTTIPVMYTKQGYIDVVSNKIPRLTQHLLNGNWVLGANSKIINDEAHKSDINNQIKSMYTSNYNNWWKIKITKIFPDRVNNFNQAHLLFEQLSQTPSPIIKLIHQVNENTSPMVGQNSIALTFNKNISDGFTKFNIDNVSSLDNLQPIMQRLSGIFSQLANAKNSDEMAFSIASKRFAHNTANDAFSQLFIASTSLPQPFANEFNQLALKSWFLVMKNSGRYISTQWQQQVLSFYNTNLSDRFPIDSKSSQDVNLSDFSDFFIQGGVIDNFSQKYIKPFVDDNKNTWPLKSINGLHMALSQDFINQLIRASLIRKMYFHDNQLGFDFTMQANSLEPIVKNIKIVMDKKVLYDYQGSKKISHLHWPNANDPAIHLTITNIDGSSNFTQEQGPWALFRLLKKANLKPLNDTMHYSALLDLNGSAAQYLITTKLTLNPLIPHVTSEFNCPKTIG